MPNLGNFIKRVRVAKGMTQADLARLLHVTDKAVSKWERNLSYPDIRLFPKLADVFEVPVSQLLKKAAYETENDNSEQDDLLSAEDVMDSNSDFRAPIHIIMGSAELVEKYADDPDKMQYYLDLIRLSCQYILENCEFLTEKHCHQNLMHYDDLVEYYLTHAGRRKNPDLDLRGKRILIVDNVPINREMMGIFIQGTGAEIDFAENGEQCIRMLTESPAGHYDLILMDIAMPEKDGFNAAKQIRNLPDTGKANIPIVAVNASTRFFDEETAIDAGLNYQFAKPYDLTKMLETLQMLLGQ